MKSMLTRQSTERSHHHLDSDIPEKLDYESMARILSGGAAVIYAQRSAADALPKRSSS
jgi:hypothetical protein